jgi:hypothetical protein
MRGFCSARSSPSGQRTSSDITKTKASLNYQPIQSVTQETRAAEHAIFGVPDAIHSWYCASQLVLHSVYFIFVFAYAADVPKPNANKNMANLIFIEHFRSDSLAIKNTMITSRCSHNHCMQIFSN